MDMDIEDKDSVEEEFKKAVMEKRQQVLLEKQRKQKKAEKMDEDGVIIILEDDEEVKSNEDNNKINIEMPASSGNKPRDMKIKSPHKKHSRIKHNKIPMKAIPKPTVQTNLRGEQVDQLAMMLFQT